MNLGTILKTLNNKAQLRESSFVQVYITELHKNTYYNGKECQEFEVGSV